MAKANKLYRDKWENLSDAQKIELLHRDVQSVAGDLGQLRLGHQNLMSAHAMTAQTLKEAVSELERVRGILDREGRRPTPL